MGKLSGDGGAGAGSDSLLFDLDLGLLWEEAVPSAARPLPSSE